MFNKRTNSDTKLTSLINNSDIFEKEMDYNY